VLFFVFFQFFFSFHSCMSVLIVGSVALDAIETPFGKTDKIVGGSGSYFSLAASFFHSQVQLVSVVGYDFPTAMLDTFRQRGIDIGGVEIKKDEKSFFWSGVYGRDLNTRETLVTELNVLGNFNPQIPEAFRKAGLLMLGNLAPAIQRSLIAQMETRPRLIVMDTMNFWMDLNLEEVRQTVAQVDVLTINDEEARQLSGHYSLRKAAREILALGPRYLIIKKGEHGALLFGNEGVFFAPALPLEEVFDPTGAGDTFAGGLVGYLASVPEINFERLKNGILYGSALASFCVEKFGVDRLLEITREEVQERYRQFVELTRFEVQTL
jgi:sugar/nucleoside kinase (ribokinase family)